MSVTLASSSPGVGQQRHRTAHPRDPSGSSFHIVPSEDFIPPQQLTAPKSGREAAASQKAPASHLINARGRAEHARGKGSNKAAAYQDDNFMEIIVIIINGYQLCIALIVNL